MIFQDELLKSQPKTLYSALEVAQNIERSRAKPKRVNPVNPANPANPEEIMDLVDPDEGSDDDSLSEDMGSERDMPLVNTQKLFCQ